MFPFYTPWKRQKHWEHWPEMSQRNNSDSPLYIPIFFVLHFDYDVATVMLRGWKSSEANACKETTNVASWMTKVLKISKKRIDLFVFLRMFLG